MLVQKASEINNENTRLAFSVFDRTVMAFAHLIPYSFLKFVISNQDRAEKTGSGLTIEMSYDNNIIQDKDEASLRVAILRAILKSSMSEKMPEFIENIIIDRALIKSGLGDELACYYFASLSSTVPSSIDRFLKLNSPWISFYGIDRYNSDILKDLAEKHANKNKFNTKKLFSLMKKDLTKPVIGKIIKEYRVIQCKS